MTWLGPALLIIAALINLAPLVGVVSGAKIAKMYDVDASDPNVAILMRHRAVLFGIVGGMMVWGAIADDMFIPTGIIGLISMMSYLILAVIAERYNQALRKVLIADIIGIAAVVGALGVRLGGLGVL